jgi:hypothetical protein
MKSIVLAVDVQANMSRAATEISQPFFPAA